MRLIYYKSKFMIRTSLFILLCLLSCLFLSGYSCQAKPPSAPHITLNEKILNNAGSKPIPPVKAGPDNNTVINDLLNFDKKSSWSKVEEAFALIKKTAPGYASQVSHKTLEKTAKLISDGVLDAAGGLFAIDPTGSNDSTAEIQRAIEYARDNQLICYFPAGEYRISTALHLIQRRYMRSGGAILGAQSFPCVVMGSSDSKRTRFIVSKNSFPATEKQKAVFDFQAESFTNPSVATHGDQYNQLLVSIDIVIEENNPSAIAIRQVGAQGCLIQDVSVRSQDAFCGFIGGSSAGGGIMGLSVDGGRYGIIISTAEAAPNLTDITLTNQTDIPLYYDGLNTLSIVGGRFEVSSNKPAVLASDHIDYSWGTVSIVDSSFSYVGQNIEQGPGIETTTNLYMENVYFLNSKIPGVDNNYQDNWVQVEKYAKSKKEGSGRGFKYTFPIILPEEEKKNAILYTQTQFVSKISPTLSLPDDLQTRHRFGAISLAFERPKSVNVKDVGAKGDTRADDTEAIQRALDAYDDVFIPKGIYRITRPLRMRPNNTLSGVGRHLSLLMADPASPSFSNKYMAQPLLTTADNSSTNHLAYLGLYVPRPAPGAYALRWRCDKNSTKVATDVVTWPPLSGSTVKRTAPLVLVDGGAGRWDSFIGIEGSFQQTPYRHLHVKNSRQGFSIYKLNLEHARTIGNMEIENSANINMYSLKTEGNYPIMLIRNSENIALYAYGGHAAAFENTSLFNIRNSSNIMLVNMIDNAYVPGDGEESNYAGRGVDPTTWTMIKTDNFGYSVTNGARPVLFWQRGK